MEIKTYYRDGYEPTYATDGSSGIDLKATEDCCIEVGGFKRVTADEFNEDTTERGDGGFGSTGIK